MPSSRRRRFWSFNTQPPEGGCEPGYPRCRPAYVSTLSHPKVAASAAAIKPTAGTVSTLSHPKVAAIAGSSGAAFRQFQHSATRRWLLFRCLAKNHCGQFQHSATRRWLQRPSRPQAQLASFNTQPPEGGCGRYARHQPQNLHHVSTLSHPKVAAASLKSLAPSGFAAPISLSFQEKREREYNTAFSVTPSFTIS